MKHLVFFVILIGCIAFVPEVLGATQNLFEGNSSFERLPDTIIPETLYEFELKFQITDSPYWLRGMTPVVDIYPKTDANNVHINFEKIHTRFYVIGRVPVTLYVDQNISSEKIFLNVSFVSENSSGDEMRSSWSESTVLNISQLSLPTELPSSQDYEFETMTGASCTYDSSACFGTFHNGTTIPIQCDYRHSCGVISFSKETYKLEEKPLKQFKSGVPSDEIQCRENLVLIQNYNGSPACVTESTKQKLIERGWTDSADTNWKKYITVSAIRYDSYNLEEFLPAYKIKKMSDDKLINQLLVGADGCKNETEVCKLPSGVSLDTQYPFLPYNIIISENDEFSISLNESQAEYLLSVMNWKNVGDSFYSTIHWGEKQYFIILSTFDNTKTPVVKMKLSGTLYDPVTLERSMTLEYPIHVSTWATYGTPATIDLLAVHNAKDSGIKTWVEPETLIIDERSNATSTLFIQAADDAKDGIYDIRVIGHANGNNAGLYCNNTVCPTVNVGNSDWSVRTFGSSTNMGIGGIESPNNTYLKLDLNKKEFFEEDVVEIKTYLINNSTEKITFVPDRLLIKVIKTQDVGYYDNLYGIDAKYESDELLILEPHSKTLLVRPFYWNQNTFESFDDEQRVDARQYKMIAKFVGESYAWNDDVWFEVK